MALSNYLPAFVRARLEGRATLRRVFDNSFWLLCDQLLRMAAGLLVGVWVARYLGPENYGWLNYALVIVGVISAVFLPGIGAVVVREVAQAPAAAGPWIGAAFIIRAAGSALGFLTCVGIAWWQSGAETPASVLVLVVAAGLLFQAADVADLLFQARGEPQVSAWVRITGCLAGSFLRVVLIVKDAPLMAFAVAGVIELVVTAMAWLAMAQTRGLGASDWVANRTHVKPLLRESWPLAVSGVAITAQAYADQFVIGSLLGAHELGQYAAAMRFVTVFGFIPMVIHTLASPEIARAKRDDELLYRRRLHSLYRVMFVLFLVTGLGLAILGPVAASLLYGNAYSGAAALLPWLALRLFFTNFGVARSVFLTNENLLRFGLVTSVVGAVVGLLLNFTLVPRWGVGGAVTASLVSFAVTTFALDGCERRARSNLGLMAQAILLPWRRFGT